MKFLHAMVRISNIEKSLHFYINILGLVEKSRYESEKGRYTNVFLMAPEDKQTAQENKSPLIELTYNWPDEDAKVEKYINGRNFGHLAFRVDDIYQFCQHLINHKVVINRPPRDGYMAFIKSPDGISIEILQKDNKLEPKDPWINMPNIGQW